MLPVFGEQSKRFVTQLFKDMAKKPDKIIDPPKDRP